MTAVPNVESSVVVRPAERADLLAVMRIERHSFAQPWPFEPFQHYLGHPGFLVAVDTVPATAQDSDASVVESPVIGFVVGDVIRIRGQPLGHVKDLAVHPDRRGEGVGSMLLREILGVLSDAETVKLEVRASNEGARSLYRQFGFEPHRRDTRYYDNGEDAIVMIRER